MWNFRLLLASLMLVSAVYCLPVLATEKPATEKPATEKPVAAASPEVKANVKPKAVKTVKTVKADDSELEMVRATAKAFADAFNKKDAKALAALWTVGYAAGGTATGPRGNTAYRGAAVGANGGVAAGRGVDGADGGSARQGFVDGPNGRMAAGGAVRGPDGGVAARGVAAGPRGYAAGFAAVSPAGRYVSATAVRGNFSHYNLYGAGWYTSHPGAWFAAGWAAGDAWRAATWNSLDTWFAYSAIQPIYYDYGNTVTYQDNSVYINGQAAGTSQQYYDQAETLATTGGEADAEPSGDWMPLGVFALTQNGQNNSNMVIQLAVNKAGIIRGNYSDTASGASEKVAGSVDKKTQRAAWTIGSNKTTVLETGLYNLTKDEAPALVHFGADRTEQWLMVRLNQDGSGQN